MFKLPKIDELLIFKTFNICLSFLVLIIVIRLELLDITSVALVGVITQFAFPAFEYQLYTRVPSENYVKNTSSVLLLISIGFSVSAVALNLNELVYFGNLLMLRSSDLFINVSALKGESFKKQIWIAWLFSLFLIGVQMIGVPQWLGVFPIIGLLIISAETGFCIKKQTRQITIALLISWVFAMPSILVGYLGLISSSAMQETYVVLSRSYGLVQKIIQVLRVRLLPRALKEKLSVNFLLIMSVLGMSILPLFAYIISKILGLDYQIFSSLFLFYSMIMLYSLYNNVFPRHLYFPKIKLCTDGLIATWGVIIVWLGFNEDSKIAWYCAGMGVFYLIRILLEKRIEK